MPGRGATMNGEEAQAMHAGSTRLWMKAAEGGRPAALRSITSPR
jgi:hypothetical protein